jgi:hypothetical protein
MSIIKPNGRKVVLPRGGLDDQWKLIIRHYAGADARRWRNLAMLALRESSGWPLECIANAFCHPKGHVGRCIARVRSDLRARFQPADLVSLCDSDDSEDADQFAA